MGAVPESLAPVFSNGTDTGGYASAGGRAGFDEHVCAGAGAWKLCGVGLA